MADVKLSWTNPTTRTDGKALPANQIAYVLVELSADGGANYGEVGRVQGGQPSEFTQTELEAGDWHFRLTVVDTQKVPKSSAPVDQLVSFTAAAPSAVMNVVVTVL